MTFVDGPVRVSVPATSANLGPGFDTLGLALDLRDELEAEVLPEGLVVEVSGAGADGVPRDERHLVVSSMRAAFDALGAQPPGLRLSCTNVVPHARGLGSSSAAIVGGLALARALVAGGTLLLDDQALFALAADLEGHPDNVAPACFGGFTISGRDEDGWYSVPGDVDPRVGAVVFVPPTGVRTAVARGLLPARVDHAAAAANAGNTALLVRALGGRPDQLLRATRDHLHQEFRRPAMPESLALIDRLRADGVPALVSGAGPTVLAFTSAPDAGSAPDLHKVLAHCPPGWVRHHLAVDGAGVRVEAG
ncbi:homoserine kinase [Nocardioides sp.]|uniref:homoserine kinase n=1 Tax=Nocardioides sp. TaxID=35761 RepID=UPI0035171E57